MDPVILPTMVTRDALKEALEAAYMDVTLDAESDLRVKDGYSCFVIPSDDGNRIYLTSSFNLNPDRSAEDRLMYVNRVNDELVVVRASVSASGTERVIFDYYILLEGGVTMRNIILSIRTFLRIVSSAVAKDAEDVLA